MNFDSLFSSNIISAAKANAGKPELFRSSAKAKDKVMKELIASVPHADHKAVLTDRNAIMGAIVKFTKKPRADGQGNWLHPDMKTSLFHYQVSRNIHSCTPCDIVECIWGLMTFKLIGVGFMVCLNPY